MSSLRLFIAFVSTILPSIAQTQDNEKPSVAILRFSREA